VTRAGDACTIEHKIEAEVRVMLNQIATKNHGLNALCDRLKTLFASGGIEEPTGVDQARVTLVAMLTTTNALVDAVNQLRSDLDARPF
jgi:hypothetical protein